MEALIIISITDTGGDCSPGHGHNIPNCCSLIGRCQVGKGGCSDDSDCHDAFVCGKDNCGLFDANSYAGMDCCVGMY